MRLRVCCKQVDELDSWLTGVLKKQGKKKDHEDPAFKVDEVYDRLAAATKPFEKLKARKKPKPAPVPTAGNATANGTADAGGDARNKKFGNFSEEDLAAAAKEARRLWEAAEKAGGAAADAAKGAGAAAAEGIKNATVGGNETSAGVAEEDHPDKSEL